MDFLNSKIFVLVTFISPLIFGLLTYWYFKRSMGSVLISNLGNIFLFLTIWSLINDCALFVFGSIYWKELTSNSWFIIPALSIFVTCLFSLTDTLKKDISVRSRYNILHLVFIWGVMSVVGLVSYQIFLAVVYLVDLVTTRFLEVQNQINSLNSK